MTISSFSARKNIAVVLSAALLVGAPGPFADQAVAQTMTARPAFEIPAGLGAASAAAPMANGTALAPISATGLSAPSVPPAFAGAPAAPPPAAIDQSPSAEIPTVQKNRDQETARNITSTAYGRNFMVQARPGDLRAYDQREAVAMETIERAAARIDASPEAAAQILDATYRGDSNASLEAAATTAGATLDDAPRVLRKSSFARSADKPRAANLQLAQASSIAATTALLWNARIGLAFAFVLGATVSMPAAASLLFASYAAHIASKALFSSSTEGMQGVLAHTVAHPSLLAPLLAAEKRGRLAAFVGKLGAFTVLGAGGLIACRLFAAHPIGAAIIGITAAMSGLYALRKIRRAKKDLAALSAGLASRVNEGRPQVDYASLLDRDGQDLKELYRRGEPGPIPSGSSRGTATIAPGTIIGAASKKLFSFLWYGKIFERVDDHSANLVNKTVLGRRFEAKVYIGKSLLDGKDAIIIDYSDTPFWPFRVIRDEIRQVGPGVYLGYAYLRGVDYAPILFALDFN